MPLHHLLKDPLAASLDNVAMARNDLVKFPFVDP